MSSQCYGYISGSTTHNPSNYVITLPDTVPCPSGGGCCGRGDACLSNSICQYIAWTPPGVSSGYYMGSCTDPTFSSPSCPKVCTALKQPGIVYDTSIGQWRCCGTNSDGTLACDSPSYILFQAPPPNQLKNLSAPVVNSVVGSGTTVISGTTVTVTSVSTYVSSGSTFVVSGSSQTTAAIPAGTSSANAGSLSTGAKAGIGAGVGVAVVIIAALIIWFFMSRKKRETPPELAQHDGLLPRSHPGVLQKNNSKVLVPEIVGLTDYPKHEYRREDGLPAYSSGGPAYPDAAELQAASHYHR